MSTTGHDHSATSPVPAYARACVEAAVLRQTPPELPADAIFRRRSGCFVTIKRDGALRGCIGTLTPNAPDLGDEIARNARAAAFRDPRFAPIGPDELPDLSYSVDVLGASEPCSIGDLDPRVYGVIVSSGARRGVLLPDLTGIDDAEQQLTIVLQKAAIAPDEPYAIERFRVERYPEQRAPTPGD